MESTTTGESGPHGPALTGTDNEALLQALRNVWPLLSGDGRRQATITANGIKGNR